MSYLQNVTSMIGGAPPIHEQHVYEQVELTKAMIDELVPPLVEKLLREKYLDILVKIQTQLNGKDVDFSQVRDYVMKIIFDELRSGLK